MLQRLLIQNYALIDHLQINFEDGFSVITGETGSGKSILLGALGLILGERADLASVRDKSLKCIIEGSFKVVEKEFEAYFSKHDLDFESETILRREISTSGKSRAFINDTPVSLSQLKEIGSTLIDIHSQHETLLINDQQFVIDLLDSQHQDNKAILAYRELFQSYSDNKRELSDLLLKETEAQNQKDYLSFLVQEFEEFDLAKMVDDDIENEYKLLANAEDIKRKLSNVLSLFNDNGSNDILSSLKQAKSEIASLVTFGQQFEEISQRIESSLIELEDIHSECDNIAESTELDERKLVELEEKNSFINRLLLKHQLSDTKELLDKYNSLQEELANIGSISNTISKLQNTIKQQELQALDLASKISSSRQKVAQRLQIEAEDLMSEMNMKHASIDFRFEKQEKLSRNGIDSVQLYVKTNLGGSFEPLKKIASGGETSRIMLAIKSLQSNTKSLPTIIFDEIDTGVSGEIANKMGSLMHKLGSKMQVLSITHLPQVAAQGDHHYKVYKTENKDQTSTNIVRLDKEQRTQEIAMLLSGSDVTSAALKNAEELLKLK